MLYVDFHAHVLPGADHGSDGIETSLAQLKQASLSKIGTIVATPHFYLHKDTISNFLERRETAFQTLQSKMQQMNLSIRIVKACEVNLQVDLCDLRDLELLCIEKTHYMLLELPFHLSWTNWVYNSILQLRNRGIEPILAHINRYDPKQMEPFFEMGVLMQINAETVRSFKMRHRMLQYLKNQKVHFLGSDVHGGSGEHYEMFRKATRIYGAYMQTLTQNSNAILKNQKPDIYI